MGFIFSAVNMWLLKRAMYSKTLEPKLQGNIKSQQICYCKFFKSYVIRCWYLQAIQYCTDVWHLLYINRSNIISSMVTRKIKLDCSRVHEMILWAYMYVCSHVGCRTDSIFIHFCKFHKYLRDAKVMQMNRSFWKQVKFDMSSSIDP